MDDAEYNRRKLDDLIPTGLRTAKQTLTGLLKEKGSGKRFRLDGLLDVACEPLAQLLGSKRYMLSDENPSSLDCLALGYLSLALIPKVPQKWLADGMQARYPKLCAYVGRSVKENFGGDVGLEDTMSRPEEASLSTNKTLPWQAPEQRGAMAAGIAMLHARLDSIPFYKSNIVSAPPDAEAPATTTSPSLLFPAIITATTAIAAVASHFLYASVHAEPEKQRLSDMGEAGAIFSGLDFGRPEARKTDNLLQAQGERPIGLAVDIEVDEQRI